MIPRACQRARTVSGTSEPAVSQRGLLWVFASAAPEREEPNASATTTRMSSFVIAHRLAGRNSPGFSAQAADISGHCVHYIAQNIG